MADKHQYQQRLVLCITSHEKFALQVLFLIDLDLTTPSAKTWVYMYQTNPPFYYYLLLASYRFYPSPLLLPPHLPLVLLLNHEAPTARIKTTFPNTPTIHSCFKVYRKHASLRTKLAWKRRR